MADEQLNPKVLGQLLLMQSYISILPDKKNIYSFICKGLLDIPGIHKVEFFDSLPLNFENHPFQINIPIRGGESYFGEIVIQFTDLELYKPYEAYLSNFIFMIGLVLEERYQRQINHQHKLLLEQQIAERTKDLKDKNMEIEAQNEEYQQINEELTQINLELQASKEKAEELQNRFDYAASVGKVGTWDWNLLTDDLIWSTETFRVLGYEPFSVKPSYNLFLNIVHPDDRDLVDQNVKASWNQKKPYSIDCRIVLPNTEERICNATGKVEYDKWNKPIRMIGTFQDITDRKIIEISLKEIDSQLKNAMAIAKLGSWMFDVATGLFTFNEQFYDILGTTAEQEGGYTMSLEEYATRFFFPEDAQMVAAETQKALETDDPNFYAQVDHRLIDVHGNVKFISVHIRIIKNYLGQTIQTYGVNQDITDRKKGEEELLKAKERAEESDRLKTAFLQNMSHEIRTPMNAIMGFSSLLAKNFNDKTKLQKYSSIIGQRCNDLLDIINEILDIAKIESGQLSVNMDECNLDELFSELLVFFTEFQKKSDKQHIEFSIKAISCPHGNTIITDKVKLKQILINLIGNAFKFTRKGKIEGGCSLDENGNILFYVADTGIGIPSDKREIIFDRFVQIQDNAKLNYGGTGLGLPIVKGLVNILGGQVFLESEPDKGSKFSFTIPYVVSSKITEDQSVKVANDVENFSNTIILVVEDDHFNAEYLKDILTDNGIKILLTEYGKDAIEIVKNTRVDMVLMDVRLPDINGYEVTRQIKQFNPGLKIIAQTAYATHDEQKKAKDAGCDGYISKPTRENELMELLAIHLSGKHDLNNSK